jgi:phosphoenolpyruvate synthase/pyruvate phosphate dikinase
VKVGSRTLKKGDIITVDGAKGEVLVGSVKMVEPRWAAISAS